MSESTKSKPSAGLRSKPKAITSEVGNTNTANYLKYKHSMPPTRSFFKKDRNSRSWLDDSISLYIDPNSSRLIDHNISIEEPDVVDGTSLTYKLLPEVEEDE